MPSNDEQIKGYAAYEKSGALKPFSYTPRPMGPDDVEVKIDYCGICGSDIHTIDSGWYPTPYPCIVGHEIIGKVTEKGANATEFSVGDRVGIGAQRYACHKPECKFCPRGYDNCCDKMWWTYASKDDQGNTCHGGYADRIRAQHHYVFKIPDGLDSTTAAPLLCAGVTTYAPLKRFGAGPGKRVGVVGIGGLGHLGLQWAAAMGADVVAISHSPNKKEEAKRLGSKEFLVFSDKEQVKAYKASLDLILCCANPRNQDWPLYLSLLDVHGTLIIVSLPEENLSIPPFSLTSKQVAIVGSAIGSSAEVKEMLEFAAKHGVKAMVEIMPLEECQKAIEKVRKGDVRYRIVLDVAHAKL